MQAEGRITVLSRLSGFPPRNRIEHAQVVDPADIPRFKELGVIASMQPNHLLTDMNWAEERLGPKRAAYSYAWKAFLDAGRATGLWNRLPRGTHHAPFAASTPPSRVGMRPKPRPYFPENRITRGQALYAYTQGSAYAEFAEKHKGKLLPATMRTLYWSTATFTQSPRRPS